MDNLSTEKLIRYSKVILMAYISIFGLLVMIQNFTDYESNYTYVAHILSMDTTTASETIKYRAIESPMIHHRIYWFIINGSYLHRALPDRHLSALSQHQRECGGIPRVKKILDHGNTGGNIHLLRLLANGGRRMVRHGHFAIMERQGLGTAYC